MEGTAPRSGLRPTVAASVVAAIVVSALGAACSTATNDSGTPRAIEMTTYTSEDGIRFAITATYDEDRVLAKPTVEVGGLRQGGGQLWPNDDADHEGEDLDPLYLPSGTSVTYEVVVEPDCDKLDASPAIQFTLPATLSSGREVVVDRLVPSNPETYLPAIRLWCDIGVTIQAGGGSLADPGGEARVALLINNATNDDAEVEMPALASGGATWAPLSTTVPAGTEVTEIVIGDGVWCHTGQGVPWADGRILIDGHPLDVPVADVWC